MNYTEDLQSLADADNLRTLPGPVPEGMINLSSNDYLGLSQRGDLWQAFADGQPLDASMMSACSSRLLTGDHRHYAALEQTLCRLFGREAALVYPSGYHTNIGILPALTDSRDVIFADKLVHASIIDGLRLSQAAMTTIDSVYMIRFSSSATVDTGPGMPSRIMKKALAG